MEASEAEVGALARQLASQSIALKEAKESLRGQSQGRIEAQKQLCEAQKVTLLSIKIQTLFQIHKNHLVIRNRDRPENLVFYR